MASSERTKIKHTYISLHMYLSDRTLTSRQKIESLKSNNTNIGSVHSALSAPAVASVVASATFVVATATLIMTASTIVAPTATVEVASATATISPSVRRPENREDYVIEVS